LQASDSIVATPQFNGSENLGLKQKILTLAFAFAAIAAGQTAAGGGGYQGPGVLSRGVGSIGQRSGHEVDLRFFATVSADYDSGIQPFSLDSNGKLTEVGGLYGIEGTIGVYGVHNWRRATLGLDYVGNYRHYTDNSFYDGSDQSLALAYSIRRSRRLAIDMRQTAGTSSRGLGAFYSNIPGDLVNQPTSLLFDNRTYYTQSTMAFTFIQTARTSYSAGGDGFLVRRQSKGLVGMNGFSLFGTVQHRQTKSTTIGATYTYTHYDYPRAFGEADVNQAQATYSTLLGRRWTLSLGGGVARAEVRGIQQVAVDPVIAALTGQASVVRTFYRVNTLPSISASLTGILSKTTSLSFSYSRGVNGGNGLYLTSRGENAGASLSYSGIRRASLSLSGGYSTLGGLSQGLSSYSQWNAGAGGSYSLGRAFQLTARYDARQTDLDTYSYHRIGYRVSFGITFSPGTLPVSFW
jgi:hypothetical protein